MRIDKNKKFTDFYTKSTNPRKIDFLILHHIEADSYQHAIDQLTTHKVSSHYLIDNKGKILQLVDDNDIAYHAGHSSWRGFESLNKNSIGIEIINSNPFKLKFRKHQLINVIKLCKSLISKHNIAPQNIIGHSDIAYYPQNSIESHGIKLDGLLDRKQDPSHLFNWKFLAQGGVGIFPETNFKGRDKILYKFNDRSPKIIDIKRLLNKFGYKVTNFSDCFDLEMQMLARVFNRHYNPKKFKANPDIWWLSSEFYLEELTK